MSGGYSRIYTTTQYAGLQPLLNIIIGLLLRDRIFGWMLTELRTPMQRYVGVLPIESKSQPRKISMRIDPQVVHPNLNRILLPQTRNTKDWWQCERFT